MSSFHLQKLSIKVGVRVKVMLLETKKKDGKTLRQEARQAKNRIKSGFWQERHEDLDRHLEKARECGFNESKAGRFFAERLNAQIEGKQEDEFYLRVKKMLLENGEVSDAIGRLTDKAYYATLTYEEKQRYTLALSERYLRALERFRREYPFDSLQERVSR